MALNAYSRLNEEQKPVTLPKFAFRCEPDIEHAIKDGAKAWAAITKAESASFGQWLAIGRALEIGRTVSLRLSGSNRPIGRQYSRSFAQWAKRSGFQNMPKSVRSYCIELAEHAEQIIAWRNALPEKQRRHLINPQSITRRWKAATQHNGRKCPTDLRRDAMAAWKKFVACVESLPREQGLAFWQLAQEQAAARIAT